jgi:hypothetical protein
MSRVAIALPNKSKTVVAVIAIAVSTTSTPLNLAYGEAECGCCLADLKVAEYSLDGHINTNHPRQASPWRHDSQATTDLLHTAMSMLASSPGWLVHCPPCIGSGSVHGHVGRRTSPSRIRLP